MRSNSGMASSSSGAPPAASRACAQLARACDQSGEDGLAHVGAYHGPAAEIFRDMYPLPINRETGTGLAIISLVWRKENRTLGQYALWLNGMLAFFSFPVMVFWLLSH